MIFTYAPAIKPGTLYSGHLVFILCFRISLLSLFAVTLSNSAALCVSCAFCCIGCGFHSSSFRRHRKSRIICAPLRDGCCASHTSLPIVQQNEAPWGVGTGNGVFEARLCPKFDPFSNSSSFPLVFVFFCLSTNDAQSVSHGGLQSVGHNDAQYDLPSTRPATDRNILLLV